MNTITIYGPGCKKCNDLTNMTKKLVAELQLNCEITKVTDPLEAAAAGVAATPALAIDGKVMVKGYVPTEEQLSDILKNSGIPAGGCNCGGTCEAPAEETPAPATSCCSASAESTPATSCCSSSAPAEKTSGSCCSGGGCCSDSAPASGCKMVKQLILWVVLILVGFAVYKAIDNKKNAAESASANAAPAITQGVEVVYYQFGARCVTCQRMEKWIQESVSQEFADQIKNGTVILKSVKAGEADVQKYALATKSLIIKNIESGTEKSWKNAEKIWEFARDEAAFKAYVTEQVKAAISAS